MLKNLSNISVCQVIDYYVKNGFNEKTADIIVEQLNMLEDLDNWDTEMFIATCNLFGANAYQKTLN